MKSNSRTTTPWFFRWYGITLFLLAILLTHIIYVPIVNHFFSSSEDKSAFGDSYGALNSLFSGLAFFGVVCAIWLQRQDIRMQREEMQENSESIHEQREQSRKQQIESEFFRLLTSFQNVVDQTRHRYHDGDVTMGRDAFDAMARSLVREFEDHCEPTVDRSAREYVANIYGGFYAEHRNKLGHVFRLLYHIVTFIDSRNIDDEEKRFYLRLLRAHMSNSELLLLFYNGLSDYGFEKFFPLIERYRILQNLDVNTVPRMTDLTLYPQTFGPV